MTLLRLLRCRQIFNLAGPILTSCLRYEASTHSANAVSACADVPLYGQFPPLVNASRKPGAWQAYDIVFTAPRFKASGELDKPAIVTVLHNGVVVHHATAFYGPTQHRRIDAYSRGLFNMASVVPRGPVALQDHGNPIHYRNVWLREIADDQ